MVTVRALKDSIHCSVKNGLTVVGTSTGTREEISRKEAQDATQPRWGQCVFPIDWLRSGREKENCSRFWPERWEGSFCQQNGKAAEMVGHPARRPRRIWTQDACSR